MSFLTSLLTGQNPTLNNDINQFGSIGGFATGVGEGDVTASSHFLQSILNGDQTAIGKLLGPEINTIQTQASQGAKTASEFGSRSGGTAATTASLGDKARSGVTSMISSILGGAAGTLGSEGTGLIGTGLSAYSSQANASEARMNNWLNSILGKGISGAVSYAESFAPVAHGNK